MASVNPVRQWRYFAIWTEEGREKCLPFLTKKEATAEARAHAGSWVERREVTGPKGWEVTYRDAMGRGRSKRFPKKALAERFAASVETDKSRGVFIGPKAGRITFKQYAEDWLASRRITATSREQMENRFKNHAFPVLGDRLLVDCSPEVMAVWLAGLAQMSESTRSVVYANAFSVFAAAVDNGRLAKHPMSGASFKSLKPKAPRKKVVPWTVERVSAVYAALPKRYAILGALGSGLGLRQGEAFGLSPDDFDRTRNVVVVQRQVLIVNSRLRFGPPKGGKTREVPLPETVLELVNAYLESFPAAKVTLDWSDEAGKSPIPDGTATTVPLLVTTRESKAVNRNYFNDYIWKVALANASVPTTRENGMHALRHHYASVLLDAGESIKALSEYLGHHDPGFTLRTYTHMMPSSADRTRGAVDAAFASGITRANGDESVTPADSDEPDGPAES